MPAAAFSLATAAPAAAFALAACIIGDARAANAQRAGAHGAGSHGAGSHGAGSHGAGSGYSRPRFGGYGGASAPSAASPSRKSHYEVLGVAASASTDELRKAYKKLCLKWHPDKNQGGEAAAAQARFLDVQRAYDVLSSPVKRRTYDAERSRSRGPFAGWGSSSARGAATGTGFSFGNEDDLFNSFYGNHRNAGGATNRRRW